MRTAILTPAIQRMSREVADYRLEHGKLFTKDSDGRYSMDEDGCKKIRESEVKLAELQAKLNEQVRLAEADADNQDEILKLNKPFRNGDFGDPSPRGQDGDRRFGDRRERDLSLGERLIKTPNFSELRLQAKTGRVSFDIEYDFAHAHGDNTMTKSAGFAPESHRTGRIAWYATETPRVEQMIPSVGTTFDTVKYMEETTFTNNAAPVAENATKPESVLNYTERSIPVEVIAHILPVTEQQLEDEPAIRGIIDNRLIFMLMLTSEVQILTGDGSTPNLKGLNGATGIQTQAKGSDPVPDAVHKAITKIQATGFADPSGIIMHPNDWEAIRLLKTSEGVYIYGSPAEVGPKTCWGLPVLTTTSQTENTGLVGAFTTQVEIRTKGTIRVDMGWINDDFGKNRRSIRVERRMAVVVYRGAALCKVTGI